ncbi:MAG: hypothetical protein PHI55_14085 [Burkholderiaceae bacterium]|nr:hypothetical protein [Burkholderiaceae bacterium]
MSDDNQLFVPPSFVALFHDARGRLQAPKEQVLARYELCADLAQLLVEQAQILYHREAPSEAVVLRQIHQGLAAEGGPVTPAEAQWVTQRLAELLNWPSPELLPIAPGQ